MPQSYKMVKIKRDKCIKIRFLLVLLILPVLPERSEQYRSGFYTFPEPLFNKNYLFQTPSSNAINVNRNQWVPLPSKRTSQLKVPHIPSGIVKIHQVNSLPFRAVPMPFPSAKFSGHPTPVVTQPKTCKGRKNILDDIGILSLITAMTSSSIGFYTILVNSMTSNNVGLVATFLSILIWVPSALITVLNKSGDLIYWTSNFLNGLSLVNSLYGLIGAIFGTADVVASVAGESIGIISLILSVVATFPDYLDEIIEYLYRTAERKNRRRLMYYVENYGCSKDVPRVFTLLGKPFYDIVNNFFVDETRQKGSSIHGKY